MSQINNFKTAALSISSSGDNTGVAAVTGLPLRIWRISLAGAAAVSATFKDGASTSLSGAIPLATTITTIPYDGAPLFYVSPGNAFVINLSGAVVVTGMIWYTQG